MAAAVHLRRLHSGDGSGRTPRWGPRAAGRSYSLADQLLIPYTVSIAAAVLMVVRADLPAGWRRVTGGICSSRTCRADKGAQELGLGLEALRVDYLCGAKDKKER
jgi:hypothetical protein